jgi:hypothetical protein
MHAEKLGECSVVAKTREIVQILLKLRPSNVPNQNADADAQGLGDAP